MTIFLLILALLIAILAVVFAVQNPAMVAVTFLAWDVEQSLALVLIFTLVLGIVIGLLGMLPGLIRSRWRLTAQAKKLEATEKKLQEEILKREEAERQLQTLQAPPAVEATRPPEAPAPTDVPPAGARPA
jgi:uncharacterized integral membrane protein